MVYVINAWTMNRRQERFKATEMDFYKRASRKSSRIEIISNARMRKIINAQKHIIQEIEED